MSLLSQTSAWQSLLKQAELKDNFSVAEEFTNDAHRFERYSVKAAGLVLDYSKQNVNEKIFSLLIKLAEERDLPAAIEALFKGEKVNFTESQAALHTALRQSNDSSFEKSVINSEIEETLQRMEALASSIVTGHYRGATAKVIRDVVNIGIGGSDLGPAMVYDALETYNQTELRAHFISNLDTYHLDRVLKDLDPETTIFIVVSKSFKTQETQVNSLLAREWLINSLPDLSEQQIARHFFAVTTNKELALKKGVPAENIFPIWGSIGGRFSIWSAVGLVLIICLGIKHFREFLRGAELMDQHFRTSSLATNMPVVLALLGIWNQNFLGARSQAIIPYDQRLRLFPSYLQQLLMESLGKQVTRHHEKVDYSTGVVIWGGVGTNSQHAFHQLFMQGTQWIPIDFILCMNSARANNSYHGHLIANCLGQARTLMQGKSLEEAKAELLSKSYAKVQAEELAPYLAVRGGCPSNIILMDQLTPENLGALIALYEHMTYVQAVIWDIDPFDQWGVEWGKKLANEILDHLPKSNLPKNYDSSTLNHLRHYQEQLNKEKT